MTAVFSSASRLPVLLKNKTVFHITAVLHITVVFAINCVVSFVWFLFEIRHAKQCWFHHAKTKIRLHIPPLNSTGGVRRRAKKTVPPATQISSRNPCTCRSKKRFCLAVPCTVQTSTLRDLSYPHVLRPKWPWQVLCCTHLFGSSSHHTSQHACHTRTNRANCKNRLKHYKR